MNSKIAWYYTVKLVYSIIFEIKSAGYKYKDYCFELIVLNILKETVQELTRENYLSDAIKNNIKNFLIQARDYQDKNRKERVKIINDIISLLNTQKYDNSLQFYAAALYIRRNSLRYLFFASSAEIKSKIEQVHNSIATDYYIMATHFDTIPDEQFYEQFLMDFVKLDVYYESINTILREMPSVFTDTVFYNRVMNVLSFKDFFEKENNSKLTKKINKKVKKFNKSKQV